MTTTELDPTIFPYRFECADCPYDSTMEVTHEEATEAVPPEVEATPRQAVNQVLQSNGWWTKPRWEGWLCAQCMEDLE